MGTYKKIAFMVILLLYFTLLWKDYAKNPEKKSEEYSSQTTVYQDLEKNPLAYLPYDSDSKIIPLQQNDSKAREDSFCTTDFFYVIKEGDHLWSIARKMYKVQKDAIVFKIVKKIVEANPPLQCDSVLSQGKNLALPDITIWDGTNQKIYKPTEDKIEEKKIEEKNEAVKADKTSKKQKKLDCIRHQVAAGETWYQIVKKNCGKYSLEISEKILEVNTNITNKNQIQAGAYIQIPCYLLALEKK